MIKIRYLSLAVMLMLGITTHGQGTFDPASPAEPGAPVVYSRITLTAEPTDGGSVSGGGRYAVGESRRVYAYVNSGYRFSHWSDREGHVLSTATSFDFTNTAETDELTAHFTFDPSAPSEPVVPSSILYYRLTVETTTGGSVSGGGKYQAGKSVTLSAYAETGFTFVSWTNQTGETVSTNASFSYTTQAVNETLTANFRFDPSSPSEPDEPIVRHRVTVSCSEGGTYSGSSGLILTGKSITLYAYANSGYEFMGWYLNGEFYTALPNFSYTMGNENVDFFAQFRFNPASPSEPLMPALDKYSFYLMTVNGIPGQSIEYPLFMANSLEAKDMTFQLTFPSALMPRLDVVTVSDKATGYTTSATALNDTVYVFSMIGGTLEAVTTKLLTFYVDIPDDMPTGNSFQVKINQISVTEPDGTTVSARTRNGRMGVYKMGDVNGDDRVSVTDVVSVVNHTMQKTPPDFIEEVADTHSDGTVNVTDATAIADMILSGEHLAKAREAESEGEMENRKRKMLAGVRKSVDTTGNALTCKDLRLPPGGEAELAIELKNSDAVVALQFELALPDGMTVATDDYGNLKAVLTNRGTTHGVFSSLLANGHYQFVVFAIPTVAFSGNEGTLMNIRLQADEAMPTGVYDVQLLNVELTTQDDLTLGAVVVGDGSSTLTIANGLRGDVNADGVVNISDVTTLVNIILGKGADSHGMADVNEDGSINISDVTTLVNIILGK